MSGHSTYEPKNPVAKWFDKQLPILSMSYDFMVFPTPKNLNYLWTFGGILSMCLVIQLVTGKEVKSGQLPAHVGVVCQNVGTAYAIKRAVINGEPLIQRVCAGQRRLHAGKLLQTRLQTSPEVVHLIPRRPSREVARITRGRELGLKLDDPLGLEPWIDGDHVPQTPSHQASAHQDCHGKSDLRDHESVP